MKAAASHLKDHLTMTRGCWSMLRRKVLAEGKFHLRDNLSFDQGADSTVQAGVSTVATLENKKAQLLVAAHTLDPIDLVVFLPALCCNMRVPYCIIKGKAGVADPEEDLYHHYLHTGYLREKVFWLRWCKFTTNYNDRFNEICPLGRQCPRSQICHFETGKDKGQRAYH